MPTSKKIEKTGTYRKQKKIICINIFTKNIETKK
jgi:hypothetical protein